MYKTCMFCTRSLGTNQVIEHFPVGRRLAFDEGKGRLWVVCRKCLRWNLTPLEERWEAIEECERIFRDTPVRASTENIGIARHPGGLDLVRIGSARRREFAAWRYMQRFRRRLIRENAQHVPWAVGVIGLKVGLLTPFSGVMLAGAGAFYGWQFLRTVGRVRVGGGAGEDGAGEESRIVRFRSRDLRKLRLLPDDGEPGFAVEFRKLTQRARFEGEDARRVGAAVISGFNVGGGYRVQVESAVEQIESSGHPSRFIAETARRGHRYRRRRIGLIRSFPADTKLALEMALHEERERRALEGELWVLEQAWKEAEEIAAISDSLLLPAGTDEFFRRHGREGDLQPGA
ncbi:MAG: hypothetical protein OXI71_15650 [Gemmatimonadota bacterium]|nr:hypothetical protein [Gemmatimonadota bacterium]